MECNHLLLWKSGQWRHALRLFTQMDSEAVAHDVSSYNAVINACGRSGKIQRAMKLFQEMKTKLLPDITTYNAILTMAGKINQPELCMQLIEDMVVAGIF